MFAHTVPHHEIPAAADTSSRTESFAVPRARKKIIDIIRSRRDAILEAGKSCGFFIGMALSALQGAEAKALLLAPSPSLARDIRNSTGGGEMPAPGEKTYSGQKSENANSLFVETPQKIIDHIRRRSALLSQVERVLIACPSEEECADFFADLQFIYSRTGFCPHTLVFCETLGADLRELKKFLQRPRIIREKKLKNFHSPPRNDYENSGGRLIFTDEQEINSLHMEHYEIPGGRAALENFIKEKSRAMRENNIAALREYKKILSKSISLFDRGNLAAYLIKLLWEKNKTPAGEARRERPALARAGSKLLFFGLGKNRKVFPKDITAFILSRLPGMERDDIGGIRVLESYSFVEITESRAEGVISALNGCEFRGKSLTVNYAKKKDSRISPEEDTV